MTLRSWVLIPVLAAAVAGCGRPGSPACEVVDPGGRTVTNTGLGTWPAELSWREVWRVGGSEEAEELIFPADVAVSPDGSVAIADWGLAEIILLDPDGEWLGPVMTRGQGPGEVQAPAAVTWVDANTILVLDLGTNRLTSLDLASRSSSVTAVDPALLMPVVMAGEVGFLSLQPDQSVWIESPGPVEDGWEERSFVRWSPDAAAHDTVARSRVRVPSGVALAAWPRSLLGAGSETRVVSDPDGRYELEVFDRDGTSLVRFCHPGAPLPLSPAERGEALDEELPDAWRGTLGEALAEAGEPPLPAVISRIVVDVDGRIWIQRDRPAPGSAGPHGAPGAMHDVFLPSGRFLGSIRLPDDHRLLEARGRRVWTLHTGSLDESSIMALDIEGL